MINGCLLLNVRDMIESGNLHSAETALNSMGEDVKYDDYSVQDYKELLTKNAKWVNLCGRWTSTGGQMRSTQRSL